MIYILSNNLSLRAALNMNVNVSSPSTALHCRLLLQASGGICTVAVEDDFHHFVVTLAHDGAQVTGIEVGAHRTPWTLCPQAAELAQQFVGLPLTARLPLRLAGIDSKQHCTHQYDLAVLALSHALRGGRRDYLIEMTDLQDRQQNARLWRNGALVLDWRLNRTLIESADGFDGRNLRGVMDWAAESLDDDTLEALVVLRRAVMVSGGRVADLQRFAHAGQAMSRMAGGCFVFQPGRAEHALRNEGNTRTDLHDHTQLLTDFGLPHRFKTASL
ncbi:MAG: hypothetical protein JWR74_596 [Polaromonas sp.]|nr:hypothetical protein [Polaromonas sp.]